MKGRKRGGRSTKSQGEKKGPSGSGRMVSKSNDQNVELLLGVEILGLHRVAASFFWRSRVVRSKGARQGRTRSVRSAGTGACLRRVAREARRKLRIPNPQVEEDVLLIPLGPPTVAPTFVAAACRRIVDSKRVVLSMGGQEFVGVCRQDSGL